jgi:hypothetical protein
MKAGQIQITEKRKSYYDNYDRIFRFNNWYYDVIKLSGHGVIKTTSGDIRI